MAARTGTTQVVRKGVNGENVRHYYATTADAFNQATADTMALILPNYEAGAWMVQSVKVWRDGAGDPGARTRTPVESGIVITSFDESTGVLTLTNTGAGAQAAGLKFLVTLVAAD